MTTNVLGYAAPSPTGALAPFRFDLREPPPDDVTIEILYCGGCGEGRPCARSDFGSLPMKYIGRMLGGGMNNPS
jgi:uncharacterized zinc-type alcohol dehydrogenase-like protein